MYVLLLLVAGVRETGGEIGAAEFNDLASFEADLVLVRALQEVVNPSNDKKIADVSEASAKDVDVAV